LQITVTDDGIGIPPALLPRIFEPFVQGERKLHGSVGGLGIGLALVKNLAEMYGGEATAYSAGSSQGSTFTVRLPFVAAPAGQPDHELNHAQGKAAAPSSDGRHRRILVVDDNVDAADTLADMLRTCGHAVTVAYTADTALRAFAAAAFDLAILDIGLPGIS